MTIVVVTRHALVGTLGAKPFQLAFLGVGTRLDALAEMRAAATLAATGSAATTVFVGGRVTSAGVAEAALPKTDTA